MEIIPLNQINAGSLVRYLTNLPYMDKVLGGGLVKGSSLLLAGLPGAGKSTMLIELSYELGRQNKKVLYIAGEENVQQVKMRAQRLAIDSSNVFMSETTTVEEITQTLSELKPDLIIVDSLQMLNSSTLKTAPGTPSQMRYGLMTLCHEAKSRGLTIIFIGHATKGGYIAGLQTFQHIVDVVVYLGMDEDGSRFIKTNKNRFGDTSIIIPLYMNKFGLFDYPNFQKPWGMQEINCHIQTTSNLNGLQKSILMASYGWLKDEAKKRGINTTLTSKQLEDITKDHPVWKKAVYKSLEWSKQ